LITGRTAFTVPTTRQRVYRVTADGGRWRFEVVLPPTSTLPRKIFQIDWTPTDPGESVLPAVQILPGAVVGGTIKGSWAAPGCSRGGRADQISSRSTPAE